MRPKVSRKELHLHPIDSPTPSYSGSSSSSLVLCHTAESAIIDDFIHNDRPSTVDVDMSLIPASVPPIVSSTSTAPSPLSGPDVAMDIDTVDSKELESCREESTTLKDKNGVSHRVSASTDPSSSRASVEKEPAKEKRKKEYTSAGPAKKRKVDEDREASLGASEKANGKRKAETDIENDRNSEAPSLAPKQRKRKRVDGEKAASGSSTKRTSKSQRKARADPDDSDTEHLNETLDDEAKSLHATICGVVIETLAMSRASSLSVSSIYKLIMREQPALKCQRTDREWTRIFERVLRDGEAGRGSGVFGKVESSGKDESDRPLEAQWFYVPELDEDQERATVIRSMMPRPAKRSETKKYKQYYWRPLDKISKWDPEDEL